MRKDLSFFKSCPHHDLAFFMVLEILTFQFVVDIKGVLARRTGLKPTLATSLAYIIDVGTLEDELAILGIPAHHPVELALAVFDFKLRCSIGKCRAIKPVSVVSHGLHLIGWDVRIGIERRTSSFEVMTIGRLKTFDTLDEAF